MSAISTRYPTTSSRSSTYLPTTTIDSYRRGTYSTYSSTSSKSSSSSSDPTYRRSSILDRYDTPTASSRFGVSRLTSAIQTSSIPSTRAFTSSTALRKSFDRDYSSKPPIGGSGVSGRYRSDSRLRELSLERNGYTSSLDTKHADPITTTNTKTSTHYSSPNTLNTTKRSSTTSLARSLATSGADLYEKYSVANYKPNCELSRSRSLTDSKLDTLNTSHTAAGRRSTSKDRSTPAALGGSLLAGNSSCAAAKDYLTPSVHAIAQVKAINTNDSLSVCAINLANSRCFSASPKHLSTNTVDNNPNNINNHNNNNNNNSIHNNYNYNNNNLNSYHPKNTTTTTNTTTTAINTTTTNTATSTTTTAILINNDNATNRKHPIIIKKDASNNNITLNALSDAICVSAASNTNNPNSLNSTRNIKSVHNTSIVIDTKCDAIKTLSTANAVTVAAQLRGAAPIASARDKLTTTIKLQANGTHTMMNGYKTHSTPATTTNTNFNKNNNIAVKNGSCSNNHNNNNNNHITNNTINKSSGGDAKSLLSSNESFRRSLGHHRLSPYNDPNFLKCEYDLARSQVINSRSKSVSSDNSKLHNGTSRNNNHSTNNSSTTNTTKNGFSNNLATTTLSASAKDLNRNRIQTTEVNAMKPSVCNGSNANDTPKHTQPTHEINSNESVNVQPRAIDQLDEIKFIDSDEGERKQSIDALNVASLKDYFNDGPAIAKLSKNLRNSAMPSTSSSSSSSSTLSRQRNSDISSAIGKSIEASSYAKHNGTPRKAVHDESLSTSPVSSTSPPSSHSPGIVSAAKSDRSASPNALRNLTKDYSAIKLDSYDASSDNAKSSSISTLPPTPSRYDRDSKLSASISSRSSYDTDSYKKPSILDKSTDDETTEGLCGLRNIGNTCFMNSIIQCLSHTKDLTRYLKTKVDMRSSTKDARIVVEFSKLIKEMWNGMNRSVTPSELKLAFSAKHRMYSGCSQQDAQEFLRFFLDALHCALNTGTKGEKLDIDDNLSNNTKADRTWEWYSKVENSMIKDLFVGQLKSSLKCTVCGNSSVTFDPFWDLSVPLPTSSRCKLESCLDLFIKEEILDGDEMPTCSKCKTRRKSTKSFIIQRFPKYLVIHLKRFSETRWSKLSNVVEFPMGDGELNMSPYSANSQTVKYSLYGVCNHMGSTAGGHYVAACKHPTTRNWNEFNDNIVSPVYESGLVSSSAYVLFYERV